MPYKDLKVRIEFQRKYRKKNREKLNAYCLKRYHTIPKVRARLKRWKKAHPQPYKYKPNWSRSITRKEYRKKLISQKNLCAICRKKFGKKLLPVLDHCHQTNQVRELLCSRCNSAIGLLLESVQACKSAAKYLIKWKRLLAQ